MRPWHRVESMLQPYFRFFSKLHFLEALFESSYNENIGTRVGCQVGDSAGTNETVFLYFNSLVQGYNNHNRPRLMPIFKEGTWGKLSQWDP